MSRDIAASENPGSDASLNHSGDRDKESFSGKVIRNTLFNVFGNLWSMGIRFFVAPYVLYHIGNELYGVWAIVGILTGYFGLLDFGLSRSFDKYFAEYYTRRDFDKFNKVFNAGILFYLAFSFMVICLSWSGYDTLMGWLGLSSDRLSPDVYGQSVFAILGSVLIFCWGMSASVFGLIMIGLQRMDVFNKITVGMSILGAIGTVVVLEAGYGLRGLVVSNGVVAFVSAAVTAVSAFYLVPSLRINPFKAEWTMFKNMFGFGTKLQVAKLANLLAFQLNGLLISRFFHVSLVTPYSFASGFIGSVRNVVLMLPSAVIPATAELEARNEKERSLEFYERGTRYLVLLGTPVCMFSIVSASLIILAWLGKQYPLAPEATLLIQILAIGYYANLSTGVATGVAVGMGRPEYEMKFGLLLAALSLILSLSLIKFMGFYGPALASTLALTVAALYFYRLFHRHLNQPLTPFLSRIYRVPILSSLVAGALTYLIQRALTGVIHPEDRITALGILGFEGFIFLSMYFGMVMKTSYLDLFDRNLFSRYMARLSFR